MRGIAPSSATSRRRVAAARGGDLLVACACACLLRCALGLEASPQLEAGRLGGKVAVAEFGELTGGQLTGTVEFAQCEGDGVFVKVNIVDAVSGVNCLTDLTTEPCIYQINNIHLPEEAVEDGDVSACGTAYDIFDPLNLGAQGWSTDPEDICSNTQSISLGKDSKLSSCPVGGLSRKWGVLRSYFDESLGAFNNIIGLSVMLYRLDAAGMPVVYGCAPIRFKDNCSEDEKNALLSFRENLDSGADLLPSWVPENDMCDGFVGVRCDGQGRVAQILLHDIEELQKAALAHTGWPMDSLMLNSTTAANGTLAVDMPLPVSAKLVGTIPEDFSSMTATKTIQMSNHQLYGSLPPSWSMLAELRTLNVSSNNLTGTLPPEWQALHEELRELDLSKNDLAGELPSEWATLAEVKDLYLDLHGNRLVGTVPPSWSSMGDLAYVDLSSNDGLCDALDVLNATQGGATDECGTSPRQPPSPPGPPGLVPPGPQGGTPSVIAPPAGVQEPQGGGGTPVGTIAAVVAAVIAAALLIWFASKQSYRCYQASVPPAQTPQDANQGKVAPVGGKEAQPLQHAGGSKEDVVYVEIPEGSGSSDSDPATSTDKEGQPKGVLSPPASRLPSARDPLAPGSGHSAVAIAAIGRGRLGSESPTPSTPGSNFSGAVPVTHCASGVHPLDFAQVDLLEAAVVDRNTPLGSGGYGVVYRGTLLRDGNLLDVAVKVISNSDSEELHMSKYKSFEDEVSTLSLFQGGGSSDCIVKVYDWVLDYPRAAVFYEYLENDTLARLVHKRQQKLNYLEVLQMGYGISEGLAALHAKNVIHRDLKPDNILLDSHMRPRLTDFGISRQKDPSASSITTTNLGTWIYMAPEQFNGRLSEKSDVYSLGMVLWECWCNERPWSTSYGDDMEIWQVMYRLIHENDRPEIPPSCPSSLADIIRDCWATDPKERPTAVDVKNRLWRIILAEMRKLNTGPQRVMSPTRRSSQPGNASDEELEPSAELERPVELLPLPSRANDDCSGASVPQDQPAVLLSPFEQVQQGPSQPSDPIVSPFEQVQQAAQPPMQALVSPFEQVQQQEQEQPAQQSSLVSPFALVQEQD